MQPALRSRYTGCQHTAISFQEGLLSKNTIRADFLNFAVLIVKIGTVLVVFKLSTHLCFFFKMNNFNIAKMK